MIIYNVTIKIEPEISTEWGIWMRDEHIPEVMATGLFTSYRLLRILNDQEEDGLTYAIQYTCPSSASFDRYLKEFAQELQRKHSEKFHNKFVAIRTLMQVIEEQTLFAQS